jgi:BirA family biotin operon repressor/biotin-[acetyl-CoA-carboxylase] ligase
MSMILRPDEVSPSQIGELTVLGALAVVEALERLEIQAWIKWPNDVLVSAGKAAGVLVESGWVGDQIQYSVIGVGINVTRGALKEAQSYDFPAACLEDELGHEIDRLELIRQVLESLSDRYTDLGSGELASAWERNIAYKGKMVTVQAGHMNSTGKLIGVTDRGQLRLQLLTGEVLKIGVGGHQLRPVDRS